MIPSSISAKISERLSAGFCLIAILATSKSISDLISELIPVGLTVQAIESHLRSSGVYSL